MAESNERVRITMLLDDKTLKTIRDYGYEKFGSTNISKAVMSMVKEYDNSKETTRDREDS